MTSKTIKASALAAFASFALFAPSAMAADQTVTGGTGEWGFKQSFRTYVVSKSSPFSPNGTITTSEGATQSSGNGTFNFTPASGTFDAEAKSGNITFQGSVLFKGSPGGQTNAIQLTVSNPRLKWTGNTGTLYANVISRTTSPSDPYKTSPDVAFATVDLAPSTSTGTDTSATLSGATTVITEAGSQSLAGLSGSYPAGTAFDPISFQVDLKKADVPGPTEAGAIGNGRKKQSVDVKNQSVDLAQVECLVDSCTVDAPKRVTAEIKGGPNAGEEVKATVKVPKTLNPGLVKTVKAKLKKSSVKLLADGGKLKLSAGIEINGGGLTTSKNVKVTVAG